MTDDVVVELDAELGLIEELPYRVPIHLLAKRARDEIVALRAFKARVFADVRAEALEEAVRAIDDIAWDWPSPRIEDAEALKAAIRALREKR